MNYSDSIGIAVGGCKNGYSVLAYSPNLDIAAFQTRAALRDMRAFLRISTPLKDYYTLEFTDTFRVCSICRSSIDSAGSSGGYISVSLFIPHNLEMRNVAGVLKEMMDAYFDEYMHPLLGSPLPDKLENIETLRAILRSHEHDITLMHAQYKVSISRQNDMPVYIPADDEQTAEKVFDNPYHARYADSNKVIILPRALVENPAANNVTFNTAIKTMSPILTPSNARIHRLKPITQPGCVVSSFVLNGTKIDDDYTSYSLSDNDNLEIVIKLPNGEFLPLVGTLSQLLSSRTILHKGDDYTFGRFPYTLKFKINGIEIPNKGICPPALMDSDRTLFPIDKVTGECKISSTASSFNLVMGSAENHWMLGHNFFVPGQTPPDSLAVDFRKYTFTFTELPHDFTMELQTFGRKACVLKPVFSSTKLSFALPTVIPISDIAFFSHSRRLSFNPETGIIDCSPVKHGRHSHHGSDIPKWLLVVLSAVITLIIAVGVCWFFLHEPKEEKQKAETVEAPIAREISIEVTESLIGDQKPDSVVLTGFPKSFRLSDFDGTDKKTYSSINIILQQDSLSEQFEQNPQIRTFRNGKRVATYSLSDYLTEEEMSELRNYHETTEKKFTLQIGKEKIDDDRDDTAAGL